MSFGCRKDDRLPDSITLFVNMQGYRIQVLREDEDAGSSPPQAPPKFPPADGVEDKEDDLDETDEERWDGRRGRHAHKSSRVSASAPGAGGGGPRKSVPLAAAPGSPSARCPATPNDMSLQIPDSARSQYGTNLTPTGNIFPLIAKVIQSSVACHLSPDAPSSVDSLCEDLPEDSPPPTVLTSPTPGKALNLSVEERAEVGWSSPASGASDQEYLRNSEQRSKRNHDRPSRKLMLEAAAAAANPATPPAPALHQAPAIRQEPVPAEDQHLLLDAPIPALGAPVARGPRSKASPAEALRKSVRSKSTSDGQVLERAMRAAADKNNLDKSIIDTAAPSSSTPAPGNDSPSSPFVAFQNSSIEHLIKVAKESCILFKSAEGSPAQAVALLQARERAQAELLAAKRKIEEEAAKAKEEAARATPAQGNERDSPGAGSRGEPSSSAAISERRGSAGEPSPGSGKIKKTSIPKRRVARRPTPVGHRPVTRQARALSKETIKQDFTDAELASLEVGDKFFWSWLPANGQSGGMLLGVRDSLFEVGRMDRGQFFLSLSVLHRVSNRKLEIIGIYGPADHTRSRGFLDEITTKIVSCPLPILMGGDFNLIRAAEDKNNSNLNWPLIDLFNNRLPLGLSEKFRARVHASLGPTISSIRFFFETSWFERQDFVPLVQQKWEFLLTKEPPWFFGSKALWAGTLILGRGGRVSDEENAGLARTFSEEELEAIVKDMKTDTAPGPDGFPVAFFKRFWTQVKLGILHILNDFVLGRVDIARLNFGILSLIPKVPGADLISQYRPVALINVIFKIISKAYASRLDPVAHRIISSNQTAFIKGRNILDGPLALMEIIHDIRVRRHSGVLLKLDFEKAYDRVNWDFLGEVLRCKGFEEGYIHRILQLVSGGQTAISINAVEPKVQIKRKGGAKLDGTRAKGAVCALEAPGGMME
ncbi:hypothetical protein QYE76_022414 [Lolium multiflorum]|uniref:Reverse transcriptase domain-containing protein n=1 Tax=Lolium multiflorum TaxID=4521 RepID=A0AAD8R9J1_LOLMU|nr:hypothetical protein QYE76_022414 [Lolium multiflorum]